MKILTYQVPNNRGQLSDEIIASVPELVPVDYGNGMRTAQFSIEGPSTGARVKDGFGGYKDLPPDPPDTVHIHVPDDFDERKVAAVVKSHVPVSVPESVPYTVEDRANDLETVYARAGKDPDFAALVRLLGVLG